MSKDSRANSVLFGFDFQVNAAIVLMLENIQKMQSLKLEGNYEDIEIKLDDNSTILAQAKSVENSSSDFTNVRAKLKKSLETLSKGAQKVKAVQLIHITNSLNPLNQDDSRGIFIGYTQRSFESLPESSKKIISDYLAKIKQPLDTSIFSIHMIPFETDNDKERYKIIQENVNQFSSELKLTPGIGKKILTVWHEDIFKNGTKKNVNIVLNKKDIIWPIIVIETDFERSSNTEFFQQFDTSLYNEIVHQYGEIITNCNERYEFFVRVLSDYNTYDFSGSQSKKAASFALTQWENYLSDFDMMCNADEETRKGLIQVILYTIVSNRLKIDRIKREVLL